MSGRLRIHIHVDRVTLHSKRKVDAIALDGAITGLLKGLAGRHLGEAAIPTGMVGSEIARAIERRRQR
jgi:hypothetical protein